MQCSVRLFRLRLRHDRSCRCVRGCSADVGRVEIQEEHEFLHDNTRVPVHASRSMEVAEKRSRQPNRETLSEDQILQLLG